MKKLVLKVILFLITFMTSAFLIVCFDYFVVGNQHLGNYQAALIDKVNRLQSIEEPKIILVGDSNVCFGVDSKQIEDAIGMPVVDMGLHGGLGNAFHENMVKLGISEGDIVIVSHSSFDDNDTILDAGLAWITVEKHGELWKLIRPKDLFPMLRAYPYYFRNAFIYWMLGSSDNVPNEDTCYSRSAFNEFGDIDKRPDDSYEFTETSVAVPTISDICIDRMNELNKYVDEKGAPLLVAAYPIGYGKYTPSAETFNEFEKELREQLDCDVISHYTDYFIPYDLFYNTSLHLSKEGASIRTRQLILDIQGWMKKSVYCKTD